MSGGGFSPEDVVEMKHSLAGLAELSKTFYDELVGQGFGGGEALRLTSTWLSAIIAGSVAGGGGGE